MNQVLIAIGGLLLGCVLRTILPYVIKGFEDLQDNKPWPTWENKYLGSLGLLVIAYSGMFLASPDLFSQVVALPFYGIVAFAYFGQDAARKVIKVAGVASKFLKG